MSSDELWRAPDVRAWACDVLENMAPKMDQSAIVISLVPSDREGDVKFWVELGASIMMNKPIVAVAVGSEPVPPKLQLIADEIVRVYGRLDSEVTQKKLARAVQRVMAKAEGDEGAR